MTSKQKIALGLVGGAILALLFCAFSQQWMKIENRYGSLKIGLRSATECSKGWDESGGETCRSADVDDLEGFFKNDAKGDNSFDTWKSARTWTFILALVSVFALIGVGVLGFLRHEKAGLVGKLALLVLIVTVMASILVVAMKSPMFNASVGVFLFMLGGLAGVAGAYMLSNPATYEEDTRDPSIPRL